MKRLVLVFIMALVGIPAIAQFNEDYTVFQLGDYTFSTLKDFSRSCKKNGGGILYLRIDKDGQIEVAKYIKHHQKELEDRYDVVFVGVQKQVQEICPLFEIYDRDIYNKRQKEEAAKKDRERMEKEKRLKSLEVLL